MKKIEIVTAFFDIGRSGYTTCTRTNDQYFKYFEFWARIQNHLTVYCAPQDAEKILDVRRSYGLAEQTSIIPIEDIYVIENEIYQKMSAVEASEEYQNYRYRYGDPSNKAKYNYIMLMKWWFVADVAKKCDPDDFVAWVDFGYNHGGDRYVKSEEFNFLWEYDFPQKINVFCLSDPDSVSLIDSLQFQLDCCIGHTAIIPQPLCDIYWNYMKEAMNTLLSIGCMDDDQYLQLMVYKKYPEKHSVVICGWFEDFQKCSNRHFTEKEKEMDSVSATRAPGLFKRIKSKLIKIKNTWVGAYLLASGKVSIEDRMDPFCRRMYEKEKKYYGK